MLRHLSITLIVPTTPITSTTVTVPTAQLPVGDNDEEWPLLQSRWSQAAEQEPQEGGTAATGADEGAVAGAGESLLQKVGWGPGGGAGEGSLSTCRGLQMYRCDDFPA